MKAHLRISVKVFLKTHRRYGVPAKLNTIAANTTNCTMRFNPHAFKRAHSSDAASTSVFTDAIAATSADALPSSILHPPSSLPPATAAFICAYGRPGANQVTVPERSMAVTLSLKFNDSAPQVDHFEYHAPTGCPAFIVLLVKKQAQTENLARKALTACPELHNLDWSWKSEKYGGGHGNYLISSAVDLPVAVTQSLTAKHTFGGQPVTRAFWEIQFANACSGTRGPAPRARRRRFAAQLPGRLARAGSG